MNFKNEVLKKDEQVTYFLRSLYGSYGYSRFKMSKFEEYDLYVDNKDFLVSEGIITFMDNDGKLLALKPDVTLSIIKNFQYEKGVCSKVYYNENVYRMDKESKSFKEIVQAGLECIGDLSFYDVAEVLTLAAKSLNAISDNYVLEVSHLDVLSKLMKLTGASETVKKELLSCISQKNLNGVETICKENSVAEDITEALLALVTSYGEPETVINALKALKAAPVICEPLNELSGIISCVNECVNANIVIDFSAVNDMNYYNGIVFRGFIEGISQGVLSGGRYDKLLNKLGKNAGAIGFAVYLDLLERFGEKNVKNDVDVLILYDDNTSPKKVFDAAQKLRTENKSVICERMIPKKLVYGEILNLTGAEA